MARCYACGHRVHSKLVRYAHRSSHLAQEEKDEDDKIRPENARNALDPKFPNMKATKHIL